MVRYKRLIHITSGVLLFNFLAGWILRAAKCAIALFSRGFDIDVFKEEMADFSSHTGYGDTWDATVELHVLLAILTLMVAAVFALTKAKRDIPANLAQSEGDAR